MVFICLVDGGVNGGWANLGVQKVLKKIQKGVDKIGVGRYYSCKNCDKQIVGKLVQGADEVNPDDFPSGWLWLDRVTIHVGDLDPQSERKFSVQNEVFCKRECFIEWLGKKIKKHENSFIGARNTKGQSPTGKSKKAEAI